MPKKFTKEIFITKAKEVHGDLYDYSKVEYKNMHTKVCIIDPEYGEFWQKPMSHLSGSGHIERGRLKSAKTRLLGLNEFLNRAKQKFGDLYDYSKVDYTGIDNKICIIDPEYGEFWQTPYQHLTQHGCPARVRDMKHDHVDHIIPIALVWCRNRNKRGDWVKDRPLYKFLDSEINKRLITSDENISKSDNVEINGIIVNASLVRNNYEVISFLIQKHFGIDPTPIIIDDRQFMLNHLGLNQ